MSPSKKPIHLPLLAAALVTAAAEPAWGGVGLQVGASGGIEFRGSDDQLVGAQLRLSFPLSPLTLNPTFDYYFVDDRTFYQIGLNALYDLPISLPLTKIYAGPGVGLSIFALDEELPPTQGTTGVDGQGSRLGLNLIGGVRFDLPVLRPFVQGMVSIGEIDLVTIGGGILIDIAGG